MGPQSHRIEHFRVKWEGPWDRALGRAGQDLLADLQGALAQGLGLPVPPTLSVEDSQVVEGGSHLWGPGSRSGAGRHSPGPSFLPGPTHRGVLGAQCLLPDLQGVVEQVCGFLVLVLVPVGQRKDGGVNQGGVAGAGLNQAQWHPLGIPSGSPHTY